MTSGRVVKMSEIDRVTIPILAVSMKMNCATLRKFYSFNKIKDKTFFEKILKASSAIDYLEILASCIVISK